MLVDRQSPGRRQAGPPFGDLGPTDGRDHRTEHDRGAPRCELRGDHRGRIEDGQCGPVRGEDTIGDDNRPRDHVVSQPGGQSGYRDGTVSSRDGQTSCRRCGPGRPETRSHDLRHRCPSREGSLLTTGGNQE